MDTKLERDIKYCKYMLYRKSDNKLIDLINNDAIIVARDDNENHYGFAEEAIKGSSNLSR